MTTETLQASVILSEAKDLTSIEDCHPERNGGLQAPRLRTRFLAPLGMTGSSDAASHRLCLPVLALFGGLLFVANVAAADDPLRITAREPWSNVFGGKEVPWTFDVTSAQARQVRIGWSLAVDGSVIVRRETTARTDPGAQQPVEIKIELPPVKEGVVMPAVLTLMAFTGDGTQAAATLEKPIWIFAKDPFAGRQDWLKRLEIKLFDPRGDTAKVLSDAGVPFAETKNVDAFDSLKGGLLLVGEGCSFKEYRGLADQLVRAAAAGVAVLCLAPSEGYLEAPGMGGSKLPQPTAVILRQSDIIRHLDKRLDVHWPPDGKCVGATIDLQGQRGPVQGEVTQEEAGWPWVEMAFGEKETKLVVCGFAVVKKWGSGPTPRYLLARMMEYVGGEK